MQKAMPGSIKNHHSIMLYYMFQLQVFNQMHVWSLEKAPVMVLLLVGSSEEQVYLDTFEEAGSGNKLENKWPAVHSGNISD